MKKTMMASAGGVHGGERLNLSELTQEEAAQMRELIHGSLCLGERTWS